MDSSKRIFALKCRRCGHISLEPTSDFLCENCGTQLSSGFSESGAWVINDNAEIIDAILTYTPNGDIIEEEVK